MPTNAENEFWLRLPKQRVFMFKLAPEYVLVTEEYQKLATALEARFHKKGNVGKFSVHISCHS